MSFLSISPEVVGDLGQGTQQVFFLVVPEIFGLVHGGKQAVSTLFILQPFQVLGPMLERVACYPLKSLKDHGTLRCLPDFGGC